MIMHDSLFADQPYEHHTFDDGAIHHDSSFLDLHHTQDIFAATATHHQENLSDLVHTLNLGPLGDLLDMFYKGHLPSIDQTELISELGPIGHILEMLIPASHALSAGGLQTISPSYEHFQPASDRHSVIGNPEADMATWHYQNSPDTCAIASQEFIIESLTGTRLSEEALKQEAASHGWYIPGVGTPVEHVGDLLDEHGIHVQREQGATLEEIADRLNHHQKVIVGVNAEDIWYHGGPDDPLAVYPGIPGQRADHAVEVIGINASHPTYPLVILNDPGDPDGRGIEIPIDIFEQAWAPRGNYMVTTVDQA
jgi:hypothetical protein